MLGVAWAVAIGLMPAFRQLARKIASKTSWWGCPLLVLGGDAEGAAAYRALMAAPELGLRPVGVLDELHQHWAQVQHVDPNHYLGTLSDTAQIARRRGVFWGVVSMARHTEHDLALVLDRYAAAIPHLLILPQFGSPQRLWHGAHEFGDLAGMRIDERLLLPLPRIVKRAMDLVLVLLGSIVVLPVCAAIALAVRLTSPGPVFYGQTRVGFGGEKFTAWKFRSMVVNADQVLEDYLAADPQRRAEWDSYQKLKDDPRVTRIGRLIRKTSLDELPQLWNVLRGDMSLVGPRPMTVAQVKEYPTFHLYTRLRPGITGLWQINGRNSKTFQERAEFDAAYVRNWSAWLDLVVLVRTVKVVLLCEGSY
jgi:Undecaprenyl-phosphate galactose phosphotransferase WbaP